ncbi:MAG: hypothetical protein GXO83_08630 [Chlorobi bacterium]|nr:hypothetical protein [Chlorobiota bacterium]
MEMKDLRERLKRFYNGQSSPEEEQELIRFFSGEDIPEEFAAEKELFRYLASAKSSEVPDGFEKKMARYVDTLAEGKSTFRRLMPLYARIAGIAAGIALLVVAYFGFIHNPVKDTYSDPALAYAETQKALLYVSQNLNRGTREMKMLAAADKPVQELQKLQELYRPVKDLKKLDGLNRGMQTLRNNPALNQTRDIMTKYLNINNQK